MLVRIHPVNPQERQLQVLVNCLRGGGIVIIPTDTVYAFACDSTQLKAAERLARLRNTSLENANFSFVCYDLSHISDYARPFSTEIFKLMKRALPGPYTFILNAGNKISTRYFGSKSHKNTIGIRVPGHKIPREIVNLLGVPLMVSSLHDEDEILEYTTDPELIHERYKDLVDMIVDGGIGDNIPSTVVDCSGESPVVIREGKGEINFI